MKREQKMDVTTAAKLDLVAVADIARRASQLSVRTFSVDAVGQWIKRYPDHPEPVAVTSAGAVWYWSDWEAWLRKTGRIPGPEFG